MRTKEREKNKINMKIKFHCPTDATAAFRFFAFYYKQSQQIFTQQQQQQLERWKRQLRCTIFEEKQKENTKMEKSKTNFQICAVQLVSKIFNAPKKIKHIWMNSL